MVFIYLLILLLLILVAFQVIGRFLPSSYTAQHSEKIEASTSTLWTILINHAREKDWRSDLVEIDKVSGAGQGVGAVWKEKRRDRKEVLLKTVEVDAPTKLVREIIDHKELKGRTEYVLEPIDEQTTLLKITESIELRKPMQRIKTYWFSSKTAHVHRFAHDVKQRALFLKDME